MIKIDANFNFIYFEIERLKFERKSSKKLIEINFNRLKIIKSVKLMTISIKNKLTDYFRKVY